jgi:UrcA family protein
MVALKTVYFSMAVSLLAAAASAMANDTVVSDPSSQWSDAPSVTVRFADLDLSQAQGRSALYRRLSYAAQKVCPLTDSSSLGALMRSEACQSKAVKQAMRTIGGPMVARLATERGISLD